MGDFQVLKFKDFNTSFINKLTQNCTSFEVYSVHYDTYKPSLDEILSNDTFLFIYDEFKFNIVNGNNNFLFIKNVNKYEKTGHTFALNHDSMCIFDIFYKIIDTKFVFIVYSKIHLNDKNKDKDDVSNNNDDLSVNDL